MNLHPVQPAADTAGPWEQDELTAAAHGQARARREGSDFDELAYRHLEHAGGHILRARHRVGPVLVDACVQGTNGNQFWVLAHGVVDIDSHATQPGLRRTCTIRKIGGDAAILDGTLGKLPVLVITSHLPTTTDRAARDWLAGFAHLFFDVINIHDLRDFHRLRTHLTDPGPPRRVPADWEAAPSTQLSLDNLTGWRDA